MDRNHRPPPASLLRTHRRERGPRTATPLTVVGVLVLLLLVAFLAFGLERLLA